MGFDSGILKDELHPEWPYKKEYELYLNVWKYLKTRIPGSETPVFGIHRH